MAGEPIGNRSSRSSIGRRTILGEPFEHRPSLTVIVGDEATRSSPSWTGNRSDPDPRPRAWPWSDAMDVANDSGVVL